MTRQNFSSGTKWEPVIGYSRAVRVGDMVYVSGTTATNEAGELIALGDPYGQAVQCFKNIERALGMAGFALKDVVRTRMYITKAEFAEPVTRAHGDVFRGIMPCTSLIGVSFFLDERMLVEIEAEAILASKVRTSTP